MAHGPIFKALSLVKERENINLALVPSKGDPELEILIIKSTTDDKQTPHITYTTEILRKISSSPTNLKECVSLISERIERSHDWIVVLKCLILIHRLIINGGSIDFIEEIDNANSKCGMLSNLCCFRDLTHSNSWDYTEFVRRYGMYVVKKIELMEFDEMWLRKRKVNSCDDLRKLEEKDKVLEATYLRDELVLEKVLSRMERLQRLLQRVLDIKLRCMKKHRKLVVLGFTLVLKDSFQLYNDLSEGLSFLKDRFWRMGYLNCVKVLGIFSTLAKQFDNLERFYGWCKGVGCVDMLVEYPEVKNIEVGLLKSMEQSVKNKLKESKKRKKIESRDLPLLSMKEHEDNGVGLELVRLCDVHEEIGGNPCEVREKLIVSDQTILSCSSNETKRVGFSDNGEPSVTSCASSTNSNCEIALVEAETDLSNHKPVFVGNFDAYLANGINDQGKAKQLNYALPWTLPSIKSSVQMENQDPSPASLAVPPPSYLQLPELKKKCHLMVQEQQLCKEYVANGSQGDVNSLVQNRPSISTFVPQEMMLFPW